MCTLLKTRRYLLSCKLESLNLLSFKNLASPLDTPLTAFNSNDVTPYCGVDVTTLNSTPRISHILKLPLSNERVRRRGIAQSYSG